jgi:transposase-like protein
MNELISKIIWTVLLSVTVLSVLYIILRYVFRIDINWELFGINVRRVYCPACSKPMPYVRKPLNERQRMWGGWTCDSCGTEMDKWGKKIQVGE